MAALLARCGARLLLSFLSTVLVCLSIDDLCCSRTADAEAGRDVGQAPVQDLAQVGEAERSLLSKLFLGHATAFDQTVGDLRPFDRVTFVFQRVDGLSDSGF
jgi:hypothetical protein